MSSPVPGAMRGLAYKAVVCALWTEEAQAQARKYVRCFFVWLTAQNLPQRIISGLGEGDPYMRKERNADGGFSYIAGEQGAGP